MNGMEKETKQSKGADIINTQLMTFKTGQSLSS